MDTIMKIDSARNDRQMEVRLQTVQPSPLNPRKHFDEDALQDLVVSIQEYGVLEPIVVRADDNWFIEAGRSGGEPAWFAYSKRFVIDGRPGERYQRNAPYFSFDSPEKADELMPRWEILGGERRWRASKLAGAESIPIRVLDDIDDRRAVEIMLMENECRKGIDSIELAQGYAMLVEMGCKVKDIAEKVNRSSSAVSNAIRLLDLPEEVIEQLRSGELSQSHGKALLQYVDKPVLFDPLLIMARNGTPSKDIEKISLNVACQLDNAGAIQRLYGSSVKFPQCKGCDDYKNIDGATFCLNAKCYSDKEKEAEEAELAELKERFGEANAEISNVQKLKHGTYQELSGGGPDGCKADCEFRRPATNCDRKITVCIKPGCYNKLANAANRQKSTDRKTKTDELTAPAWALLDGREAAHKALVLMCRRVIIAAPIHAVRAAVKRSGIIFDIDMVKDFDHAETGLAFDELLALPEEHLIAIGGEIEMQQEAAELRTSDYSKPKRIGWFLGLEPLLGWFECPTCRKRFSMKHFYKKEVDGVLYCSAQCVPEGKS